MIHSKKESRRRRSHRQLQDFERRRRGGRNREIRLELPRGEPEGQEPQRRVAATPSARHAHGNAPLAALLLRVHVGVSARGRELELRRCHAPPGANTQQSTGSLHQQAIGWRRPACERALQPSASRPSDAERALTRTVVCIVVKSCRPGPRLCAGMWEITMGERRGGLSSLSLHSTPTL